MKERGWQRCRRKEVQKKRGGENGGEKKGEEGSEKARGGKGEQRGVRGWGSLAAFLFFAGGGGGDTKTLAVFGDGTAGNLQAFSR